MALDNFRTIELIWDKANKSIIKTIKTASSDTTGRYFSVKVLDEGQEVDLTGVKLQLYWEHPNFNTRGTDDFTSVDTKGLFKLTFSDEMLTNIGELNAHLVLNLPDGKITSDGFPIEVIKGADGGVVVPTNGGGLVKQIDRKIDKGNVTLNDLTQDVKEAMTGGSVAVVGKNTVLEENIVPGQITEKTTSFFERGKNLFDVSKVVYNKRIQSGPGTIVDANNYVLSDSIDVSHDAGKKVVFNDKTPLIILAFYTDDAFITAFSGTTTPTTQEAIIIPESATIMRFSLPKGYENNLQLEFGEVSTDYEPFEGYRMRGVSIKGKSIEPEHLSDKAIESLKSGGASSYFNLNGKLDGVTATGNTLYESIGILDRKGVEVSVNNGFYIINDKPFSSDFGIGLTFKPKQSTDTPPPTSDTSWRIFHVWQDADNYIECYIASNSGYLVVNYVVGGISHQLVKSGIYANKDETISIYVQFSQNNGIFAHWLQNDVSYLFHTIASIPAPPESMRQVAIGHRLRALTQGGSYFTAVFSDLKIDFEKSDGSKYLEGVWTNG